MGCDLFDSLASVADRLSGFDVRQQSVAKPKYDELERRYRSVIGLDMRLPRPFLQVGNYGACEGIAHGRALRSAALNALICSRNEVVTSKSSQPFSRRVRRAGSIMN
jgi:hypothetical protein